MKRLRTLGIVTLVLSFFLSASTSSLLAEDFNSENESYYAAICNGAINDDGTKETCRLYQQYLNNKANNLLGDLEQKQQELEELKKDIAKNVSKVAEYDKEISAIEKEIATLEASIKEMENNIIALNQQIQEREANIAEIDNNIQERMVALQSFVRVNNYIDFLIGANSFIDLIRRIEALSDIQKYDRDLLIQLDEEITKLNADKEELERNKASLEDNKKNVEANKQYLEGLKKISEDLLSTYYSQEAELEAQASQLADNLDEVSNAIHGVNDALNEVAASPGWTKPIASGYTTASTWHYPASFGGGVHLGIDVGGVSQGTTVKAVANGVVLYRANSCASYGGLGSSCGYPGSTGGGNQIYLIVRVGNRTYAIKYLHLKKDSPIAMGTIVQAGDKIGEVGSSGNSSGNHCHIEIFYLGTRSIAYYAENWNGDFSFGAGWGASALRNTCDSNGDSAPCRIAPKSVLGY